MEVHVEREPILALAELARGVVEQRLVAAQASAGFHERGSAEAAAPRRPGLILLLVEPGDFTDADLLIECAARSMPAATIAVYEADAPSGLRIVSRSPSGAASPPARRNGTVDQREGRGTRESDRSALEVVVRRARPALRLAAHEGTDPVSDRAGRDPAPLHDAGPTAPDQDARGEADVESLITAEELAMLLGDADDTDAPAGGGGGR